MQQILPEVTHGEWLGSLLLFRAGSRSLLVITVHGSPELSGSKPGAECEGRKGHLVTLEQEEGAMTALSEKGGAGQARRSLERLTGSPHFWDL